MDWAGTKPCLVVADRIVCYEWIISEAEVLFGWSWGVWRVLPFLWASFCCSCFSVVFFWCFTFIYLGGGWGAVLRHCLYFHQLCWKIFADIFVLECVLGLNVMCVHSLYSLFASLSKHCCPTCAAFISYDCTADSLISPLSAYIELDSAINYMCMQFLPTCP